MDEHSLCGLYLTGDIKMLLSPMDKKYPMDFYQVVSLPKFDNSSLCD